MRRQVAVAVLGALLGLALLLGGCRGGGESAGPVADATATEVATRAGPASIGEGSLSLSGSPADRLGRSPYIGRNSTSVTSPSTSS